MPTADRPSNDLRREVEAGAPELLSCGSYGRIGRQRERSADKSHQGGLGEEVHYLVRELVQVSADVARIRNGISAGGQVTECVGDKGRRVWPPSVYRGLSDAGSCGHCGNGQPLESVGGYVTQSRVENPATHTRRPPAGPGTAGRGLCPSIVTGHRCHYSLTDVWFGVYRVANTTEASVKGPVMTAHALSISATLGGQTVSRAQVLQWEDRRITAAAQRLGVAPPAGDDVAARRDALLQNKLDLGSAEIGRRLRSNIRLSRPLARVQAAASSRRRFSVVDLSITGGKASEFVAWFRDRTAESDERAMLRACPDHFVIRTLRDGRQEVLETTGGSPLTALFVVDYTSCTTLLTPADANYPHQIAGTASDVSGRPIGGVRHQFRDTDAGFVARLTVEFPLPTLPSMVSAHRWHLACEFSNWIETAHS